jgi:polar amino acid transport system substrate-binding protein
VVTEDGCQAVQKALNESFDVILMDIQMPNMDGYEAARTLRDKQINTPIIALTANAMKGDDIKCTKAGCNDYLTKPIDKTRLIETLRNYLDEENSARQSKSENDFSKNKNNEKCQKVIQWDKLIERGFDETLIKEVVSIFVTENNRYIEKLKKEVKAGNIEKIKFYAHGMKGSAANVGALRLSKSAFELEKMARQANVSKALKCMEKIEQEYKILKKFVSNADWIETAKKNC